MAGGVEDRGPGVPCGSGRGFSVGQAGHKLLFIILLNGPNDPTCCLTAREAQQLHRGQETAQGLPPGPSSDTGVRKGLWGRGEGQEPTRALVPHYLH